MFVPHFPVIESEECFGKVDQVKGLFHVATIFMCGHRFPVIPKDTCLVFEGAYAKRGYGRIPIARSKKSIWFAWWRASAILVGGVISPILCVGGLYRYARHDKEEFLLMALLALGSMVICLGSFMLSYCFTRAKPERALELARIARIKPAMVAEYFAETLTPDHELALRNLIEEEDAFPNLAAEQADSPQNSP